MAMVAGVVLVLGATGRTGHMVVADLQRRGLAVRALVRNVETARPLLGDRVAYVIGDLRDRAALAEAAAGVTHIIFVAAANGDTSRGVPRDIEYDAVRRLVDVVDHETIRRIVLLSSAGVTQFEHPHNCSFNSVLKWKGRGEDVLRRSGLPYSIVRALGLRDRPAGQQGVRILQGDRIAFGEDIARADVATFLVDLVTVGEGASGHDGGSFGPSFDTSSLLGSTFEIYNDHTVAGRQWTCASPALQPDPSLFS